MCENPDSDCMPMRQLSDEAAVEILDFLQVFTLDFEIRYGNQIRRYYNDRSQHNIVQRTPQATTDEPPF
jgi:hypothetical protein